MVVTTNHKYTTHHRIIKSYDASPIFFRTPDERSAELKQSRRKVTSQA